MLKRLNSFIVKWSGLVALLGLIPMVIGLIQYFLDRKWLDAEMPMILCGGLAVSMVFGIVWWYKGFLIRYRRKVLERAHCINELGTKRKLDMYAMQHARRNMPILIIDDMEAGVIKRTIRQFGYENVSTRQQLPKDEKVEEFPILMIDVNGVGENRDSNGLEFALEYKARHPITQVILISAYFNEAGAEKKVEAEKVLDGIFTKGSSYERVMRPLLERCVERLTDPVYVWERARYVALTNGLSIGKVFGYEDEYVTQLQKIYDLNGGKFPYDWLYKLNESISSEISTILRRLGAFGIPGVSCQKGDRTIDANK